MLIRTGKRLNFNKCSSFAAFSGSLLFSHCEHRAKHCFLLANERRARAIADVSAWWKHGNERYSSGNESAVAVFKSLKFMFVQSVSLSSCTVYVRLLGVPSSSLQSLLSFRRIQCQLLFKRNRKKPAHWKHTKIERKKYPFFLITVRDRFTCSFDISKIISIEFFFSIESIRQLENHSIESKLQL